jgi:hypothetical protein
MLCLVGFFAWLIHWRWWWGWYFPLKCQLIFNRPRSIISQKIELVSILLRCDRKVQVFQRSLLPPHTDWPPIEADFVRPEDCMAVNMKTGALRDGMSCIFYFYLWFM